MRNAIDSKLWMVLTLLAYLAARRLKPSGWVPLLWLGILALELLVYLSGFCFALYQRRKEKQRRKLEDAQHGEDAGGGPAPAEKKGFPWGRLWLAAFLLMVFSPLLLTTHWFFFAVILLFGLPLLPVLIAAVGFCAAAEERKKEKEKGELHHAKKF